MATSNSTDFGLTAREVITFALRKLRVVQPDETVEAVDAATAMTELNVMLKGWQKYDSLWRLTEGSVTLLANDIDYALSPMPHKVLDARYYNGSTYTPISIISRSDYYGLNARSTAGTPMQVYVDYQRASSTMYVYQPLGSVGTQTIAYTFLRKFEDIDSLDNDIDVRQEHLEVVGFNLAARLADDYGRVGEIVQRLIVRADQLLEEALDDDREDEVRFVPEYAGWW